MSRKFTRDYKNDAYAEIRIKRELDRLLREVNRNKNTEDTQKPKRSKNRKPKKRDN